jgi:hypothetical protein
MSETIAQESVVDQRKPIHSPSTASRVFGQDAVIISPAENTVRMLNPTGSRIWELADGSHTAENIAVLLAEEFEVSLSEARGQVADFLADLESRGLVEWVE